MKKYLSIMTLFVCVSASASASLTNLSNPTTVAILLSDEEPAGQPAVQEYENRKLYVYKTKKMTYSYNHTWFYDYKTKKYFKLKTPTNLKEKTIINVKYNLSINEYVF